MNDRLPTRIPHEWKRVTPIARAVHAFAISHPFDVAKQYPFHYSLPGVGSSPLSVISQVSVHPSSTLMSLPSSSKPSSLGLMRSSRVSPSPEMVACTPACSFSVGLIIGTFITFFTVSGLGIPSPQYGASRTELPLLYRPRKHSGQGIIAQVITLPSWSHSSLVCSVPSPQ